MRVNRTLCLLTWTLLSPGCALIGDGVRVVCNEFTQSTTELRERLRNRKWAEAAWAEFCSAEPRQEYSKDFAQGFKDGFAEYLYRGEGEPPLVAPARYEKLRYQTPAGYHAIEDWFAGYRRGSAAAREGNYRRWITGPSSLPHPGALPDDLAGSADGPDPGEEELPSPPRKIRPPQPAAEPAGGPSVPPPVEKALPPVLRNGSNGPADQTAPKE